MNQILLQNSGHIVHNGKVSETDSIEFFSCGIEIQEGYSLRSYFQLIDRYSIFQKLNPFFPSLMEQYQKSPQSECCYDGFSHIEFGKTVEMIGFPEKSRLEIFNTFYGVHENESVEIKSIQIESLLDMPVKLGKLKHIIFGDKADIFKFETVYNLFEFIEGIAWELSFHGTSTECQLRR